MTAYSAFGEITCHRSLRYIHLRVEFPTRRLILAASEDASFSIGVGETLSVVGEPGTGNLMTG